MILGIEKMARALTPVQRRVVAALSDQDFTDAYSLCRQRQTRMKLSNCGITEPKREGAVTSWWLIRLTPLGVRVRERLLA